MTFKQLWHLLTTSRYTRSLEQRIAYLEAENMSLRGHLLNNLAPATSSQSPEAEAANTVAPKPFQIKRSWRMEKLELERQHNQREEKGKRLAKNLNELPPKLYQ